MFKGVIDFSEDAHTNHTIHNLLNIEMVITAFIRSKKFKKPNKNI